MKIVRFGAALAGLLTCWVVSSLRRSPCHRRPPGWLSPTWTRDPLCPGCDDVVVAVPKLNAAVIRFRHANGTFSALTMVPVPRPVAVATADCDADGDLAVFVLGLAGDLHVLVNDSDRRVRRGTR